MCVHALIFCVSYILQSHYCFHILLYIMCMSLVYSTWVLLFTFHGLELDLMRACQNSSLLSSEHICCFCCATVGITWCYLLYTGSLLFPMRSFPEWKQETDYWEVWWEKALLHNSYMSLIHSTPVPISVFLWVLPAASREKGSNDKFID